MCQQSTYIANNIETHKKLQTHIYVMNCTRILHRTRMGHNNNNNIDLMYIPP